MQGRPVFVRASVDNQIAQSPICWRFRPVSVDALSQLVEPIQHMNAEFMAKYESRGQAVTVAAGGNLNLT
jgi:hypothetical protein